MAELEEYERLPVEVKRILVATDGSAQAFKAFNEALYLAAVTEAELVILMVADLNTNVSAFEMVSLSGYVPAELKLAAMQFLADLMHEVPPEIPARVRAEIGNPGETIVRVAEEEEVDLIIMGSRGLSSFVSFFTGSVSHYVLKNAYCPVMVTKGMPDDWEEDEEGNNIPPQ